MFKASVDLSAQHVRKSFEEIVFITAWRQISKIQNLIIPLENQTENKWDSRKYMVNMDILTIWVNAITQDNTIAWPG